MGIRFLANNLLLLGCGTSVPRNEYFCSNFNFDSCSWRPPLLRHIFSSRLDVNSLQKIYCCMMVGCLFLAKNILVLSVDLMVLLGDFT